MKPNMYLIFGLIIAVLISGCVPSEPPANSLPEDTNDDLRFIVANPLDLSQIQRMSTFRSCVGHDYSGINIEGEKETLRSMKHYLEPLPSLIGTNQIKIFAPFDGKIVEIWDGPPGKGIYISAKASPRWQFIFFHVIPAAGIEEGAFVQAGEQVGTVSMYIHNFDFALKEFGWKGQIFDSPFVHMKETVLEEYAQNGITLENIIVSKQTRDANPCPVEGSRNGDALFTGYRDQDFVALRSNLIQEVERDTTEPAANLTSPVEPASQVEEDNHALFPGGTVLYQKDGLTFEHYFPNTGSLKSDESEILIYNGKNTAVQIISSDMKFIADGKNYEQYSGTWEKFPSIQSWEKIEYVNIHPRYYQGQPLILELGQKGKLHWHYQFGEAISGKEQAVDIEISYKIRAQNYTLKKKVEREENGESISSGEANHDQEQNTGDNRH